MIYDKDNKRLILSDSNGNIMLMDASVCPPILNKVLSLDKPAKIRGLCFDHCSNIILASGY
jgi:hypothetical protein